MISRCYIEGASGFHNYGGRGITVCDTWRKDFWSFANDMGDKPSPDHSIDRIDSNGNYEPSNCRWASRAEQARNKRAARIVNIEGKDYHVADLQDKYGVDMKTIYHRAKNELPFGKVVSKEKLWNNVESQIKAVQKHAEMQKARTQCKRGHEFSPENTYLYKTSRHCLKCKKEKYLSMRAKKLFLSKDN